MSNIDILSKHNFKFNKAYGQNFIFDKNFLYSLVNGIIDKDMTILEIGPGAGTLTAILCEKAKKVISYEIDKNLKPVLEEKLAEFDNSEIVFQDIMKAGIVEIEEKLGGEYSMVANLPYYITTPIIFKFLENATKLKSMTIMVQLEVAERLVAKPNTKDYGAITPAIDYRANAQIIKKVPRTIFTPAPNVDSAFVKIDFVDNKYNILDKRTLDLVIKSAFAMRRKTLENNLKSTFKISSEIVDRIITNSKIKSGIRGESLSTEDFVTLSNNLYLELNKKQKAHE